MYQLSIAGLYQFTSAADTWLQGKQHIGVTAGASAPEILVRRVVDRIRELTGAEVGQLARLRFPALFAITAVLFILLSTPAVRRPE